MKKSIFAILSLSLMTIMGIFSIICYFKTHSNKTKQELQVQDLPGVINTEEPTDALSNYIASEKYAVSGIEIYTNQEHPFAPYFKKLLELYDQYGRSDIILNGDSPFVRLRNGYYTFPFPYSHPVELWNTLLEFTDWLKVKNIKYLSLIAADKGDDRYSQFPEGVPLGYSRIVEEYNSLHKEHGIEFLESSRSLIAANSDFLSWFYKTDHHWNVHAGLLVARETAGKLNEMGIPADTNFLRRNRFSLKIYPKSFLGSMGRILGSGYKEDFEVLYPEFQTDLHLQIPESGIDRTGDFDSTLIFRDCLKMNNVSYSAFLSGDHNLLRIENQLSTNNTKVLVLKQSKANVFCPYFALTVRYLDVIDPRHFKGSIRAYIEQTKPDIVITCADVMYEGSEKFWKLQ